ncbi:XisI protein [Anaerolineales bacterium HSG24]|nr:XisI protein [Anaerolineales bacterium HSG24]
MDRVTKYRTLVKDTLQRHADLINRYPRPEIETDVAFDEQRDNYFLFKVGWTDRGRVRGIIIHIRLRYNKIYIEEDWTEDGIATDLLQARVPREDIVLAFHPPEMRQHTEFAVA